MPAGGDSLDERDGTEAAFEGSMRVLDLPPFDIDKSAGKVSLIKTRADLPTAPNSGKVQVFLDIEGGACIQPMSPSRVSLRTSLALLRQFFRLGVRGLHLTHKRRISSPMAAASTRWGAS